MDDAYNFETSVKISQSLFEIVISSFAFLFAIILALSLLALPSSSSFRLYIRCSSSPLSLSSLRHSSNNEKFYEIMGDQGHTHAHTHKHEGHIHEHIFTRVINTYKHTHISHTHTQGRHTRTNTHTHVHKGHTHTQ